MASVFLLALSLIASEELGEDVRTSYVPLRHVSPGWALECLGGEHDNSWTPVGLNIGPDYGSNSIVLRGESKAIAQFRRTIASVDVPQAAYQLRARIECDSPDRTWTTSTTLSDGQEFTFAEQTSGISLTWVCTKAENERIRVDFTDARGAMVAKLTCTVRPGDPILISPEGTYFLDIDRLDLDSEIPSAFDTTDLSAWQADGVVPTGQRVAFEVRIVEPGRSRIGPSRQQPQPVASIRSASPAPPNVNRQDGSRLAGN